MRLPPKLVVFDTNVIRGLYLPSLLRGDHIRDLLLLRAANPPYTPAICVKTLYEILGHLKDGRVRNLCEFGYPGGLPAGAKILAQSHSFKGSLGAECRFQQIEEFSFFDWDEHLEFAKSLVRESDHDALCTDYKTLAEFAEFKENMYQFLNSVWDKIEREFFVIERHDVYGTSAKEVTTAINLERELALNCFVPSEDFEIVVAALATEAVALVTNDNDVLRAGLSVAADYKTAFVAQHRLREAIESGFDIRIYWPEKTMPQK